MTIRRGHEGEQPCCGWVRGPGGGVYHRPPDQVQLEHNGSYGRQECAEWMSLQSQSDFNGLLGSVRPSQRAPVYMHFVNTGCENSLQVY